MPEPPFVEPRRTTRFGTKYCQQCGRLSGQNKRICAPYDWKNTTALGVEPGQQMLRQLTGLF